MSKKDYEIYRRIHSEKEYFSKWKPEQIESLDDSLRLQVYNRYKIKAQIFQRDKFECVNDKCNHKDKQLEMHHVLPQSMGGVDSVDNCITVCSTCHKNYHSGRKSIFIEGEEFQADNYEKMQRRQNKFLMRKFRKELKYLQPDCFGCEVSLQTILMLMRFLKIPYYEL